MTFMVFWKIFLCIGSHLIILTRAKSSLYDICLHFNSLPKNQSTRTPTNTVYNPGYDYFPK